VRWKISPLSLNRNCWINWKKSGIYLLTDSGFGKDWDSIAADTREKLVEHSHEVLSFDTNRENVFLFYLERGYLPWYGTENHINEIS
jgi:hypothetical protein